jgi:anti-sigma factor ChrR (cupin superfamily)
MQNFNLDFSKSLVIETEQMAWVGSPASGVERKPLARAKQESGHATSIVRYQAGAQFKRHLHPLGEEIFVLSGIFSDENGDYGPGCYIRNPAGTGHTPFSQPGCVIFVKLHQFAPEDNEQFVKDMDKGEWQCGENNQQVMSLHQFNDEHVMLIKCDAGCDVAIPEHKGGEEILLLSGKVKDGQGEYIKGTWLRRPSHQTLSAQTDSLIWVKYGHFSA